MRKHFLLFFLMSLLPLGAWAQTADLEDADVSFSHIQYGGGFPVMQVLYKGQVLTQNTHFTWDGKYYTDAACETVATTPLAVTTGDAKYYVKLIGKEGTVYENSETTGWFTVEPADLVITAIDNVEKNFNGSYSDIEVNIDDITFDGFVLEQDADVLTVADHIYVQYGNGTAINAGEYTITGITGISSGNYNITLDLGDDPSMATINPIAFPANAFAITASTVTYSAAAATLPTVTTDLTDDDYTLTWHTDADCATQAVAAPTNAGSYFAKITGKGNYAKDANVVKFDAAKLTINRRAVMAYVQNKEKVYDGHAIDLEEEGNEPEIVFNGLYAADAEVKDNFVVAWVEEPGEGGYVNAGEYAMVPAAENDPDENGIIEGIDNYTFNLLETGFYAITKRPVTVTAKPQVFTYTGEEQTISTTISAETVAITAPGEDSGLVGEDDLDDIKELFTISLKPGVTIQEKTNAAYIGAILINPDAEAIALSNYTIVPVAGNVQMGAKALILIAGTYSEEYGYELNKNDISVVNSANLKAADWKVKPTFSVTNEAGEEFNDGDVLVPGTYITTITNASAIVPDNYTNEGTEEDLYTGELTITKKEIEITINQVNLNTGATVEDLNRYASVADYSDQLVNAADKAAIDDAIEFAFADGVLGEGDALQSADDYAGNEAFNAETGIYAGGVVAAEIENAKYDISFVAGNIKIGAAQTLVLDPTDPQLSLKIVDAAAACTADETEFAVSFDNLEMNIGEWYAMVLPFDIDPKEMVKAADRYVIFNELNKAKTTNSEFKFTLKFETIPAGTPFLVKFAENADDEANTKVDWSAFDFGEETTFAISNDFNFTTTDFVTFKGTYESNVEIQGSRDDGKENYVWWLCDTEYKDGTKGNNWLKPISKPHKLNPMDAYLDGTESSWSGYAPKITVEDFDGSVTSIKSISTDEIHGITAKGMYNLNGMKMNNVPTQKGVYIVNGKKVVIK